MKKEWALVRWSDSAQKWEKVFAHYKDRNRLLFHPMYTDMTTTFTLEEGLKRLVEGFDGQYALFNIHTAEMIDGSIIQK